ERASMILLPSTASEGWPKVLSEAMAYGVVPLASDVSSIPQIFKETGAGHAFPAEETQLFVDQILQYTQDRSSWKEASKIAVEAADRFTYETYLEAVKKLFYKRWKVELNAEG
ncbi:MAG: glycosyltransferase, partial [Anaerolineaceae bacterium]